MQAVNRIKEEFLFENGVGRACIDHSDKDNEREMRICMFAFYTAEKSIHS